METRRLSLPDHRLGMFVSLEFLVIANANIFDYNSRSALRMHETRSALTIKVRLSG